MSVVAPHTPVLLAELMGLLEAAIGGSLTGKVVVDGTFGAGGYSRALLAAGARVIAFDRDSSVAEFAQIMSRDFGDRFQWINRPFSEMQDGLEALGLSQLDAIVLDIGVSSMQLDQAERGFSFMRDGVLDMRMDRTCGRTAADIVNEDSPDEIAHIIWLYGEEPRSRAIAAAIARRRVDQPFTTTADLASVIEKALGGRRGAPTHPATRAFQGLRIAVNDELGELERALQISPQLLTEDGVFAVVSFHSLEDRRVKAAFNTLSGKLPSASRHAPVATQTETPRFRLLTPRGLAANDADIRANPRARSARLRAIQRLKPPDGLFSTQKSPRRAGRLA